MQFGQACQKLASTQIKTPIAFRVVSVLKAFEDGRKEAIQKYKDVLREFCVMNGDEPEHDAEGPDGVKLKTGISAGDFKQARDKFGKQEISIKTNKLTQATMEQMQDTFSPAELITLEPIYEMAPEAKLGPVLVTPGN